MTTGVAQSDYGWKASLKLCFRPTPLRTVLAERKHHGPLAVQRAFYPEGDCCHVYLLHPPGGVAGGDQLDIRVDSQDNSQALITTPGASKFYHSVGPQAQQLQTLNVSGDLEWLPQENILFPGADVEIATCVNLHSNARFIGWEINCLGRPVINERFDHGSATFRFHLLRDGLPLLHERMVISGDTALNSTVGLRGHTVFATLYATIDETHIIDSLRDAIPLDEKSNVGITQVDGLLIARYLGDSTEAARKLFITLWKILRPEVLMRPACEPRIWNT